MIDQVPDDTPALRARVWIQQARQRCEPLAGGEWYADGHIGGNGYVVMGQGHRQAHVPGDVGPAQAAATAEFMAAARHDLPAALGALQAVLDACDAWEVEPLAPMRPEVRELARITRLRALIDQAVGPAHQD